MRRIETAALGLVAFAAACGFGVGNGDSPVGSDDLGDRVDECDAGEHSTCSAGEPDLPYDVKIQCGDPVIPVVAAFREENGPNLRFAPAPGTTDDCPFLIEGAVIRADQVTSCAAFVASEADATTQGNRDAGRDRVEVTWCWYSDLDSDDQGDCCVPEGAGSAVQCETDHLDIRFSCDGGEGAPDGADQPLDPDATPDSCAECDGCPEPDGDPSDGGPLD